MQLEDGAADAERSGAQQPAGDAVEKAAVLVWDGGSPLNLADVIVKGDPPVRLAEVSDVFGSLSLPSLVCGFDCDSDVKQLAAESAHLELQSIVRQDLSWHLAYGTRAWTISRQFSLERNGVSSGILVRRPSSRKCRQMRFHLVQS